MATRPVTEPSSVSSTTSVPRRASSTSARLPWPGRRVASAALAQVWGSSGIDTDTARPLPRSTTVRLLSRSLT